MPLPRFSGIEVVIPNARARAVSGIHAAEILVVAQLPIPTTFEQQVFVIIR